MSVSFNGLLLASEGSEFDVGAERVGIDLAAKLGRPLRAVIPLVSNAEFEIVAPQLAVEAEARAAAHLEALRRAAQARGVELRGLVRRGETPYVEIVAEARERQADLIVLRRRGRHGFVANLSIGATVHAVVGHAACAALVVPRAAVLWSRAILLGSDGSVSSGRATEAAAEIAVRCALPVTVVSVHPAERAAAGANVEAALALLRAAGASASGRSVEDRPDAGILAVQREVGADLIVLGRRGLGGLERLLLGSTSERVAGSADCPVLIVPA